MGEGFTVTSRPPARSSTQATVGTAVLRETGTADVGLTVV